MDINALLNRKVELIDLRDDDDYEFAGHEELELDELLQLEVDLGCTLESADQNSLFFIDEDYFEDYARELAYDLGAINHVEEWPACHIDWKAAADSLRYDYTEVEFQGNTYLFRY